MTTTNVVHVFKHDTSTHTSMLDKMNLFLALIAQGYIQSKHDNIYIHVATSIPATEVQCQVTNYTTINNNFEEVCTYNLVPHLNFDKWMSLGYIVFHQNNMMQNTILFCK